MPGDGPGPSLLRRFVDVQGGEVRPLLLGSAYHFCLLAGYFILRPLRDEVGIASGVKGLPWLFAGTLAATLLLHPLFSVLVARWPARRFIPAAYRFFAVNLVVLFVLLRWAGPATQTWLGAAFFVWTSLFNLFVVSVCWGFLADSFSPEQARRLFGFVGFAGTAGALAGAAVAATLVGLLGRTGLLLVSAALVEAAVLLVRRFPAAAGAPRRIGGTVLGGIVQVVRSPRLRAISVYMLAFTIGSTFLYFQQADLIGRAIAGRDARAALLARMDVAVQALTIVSQLFVTGRVLARWGTGVALALVPVLSIAGFLALGLAPSLTLLVVFQVLRRSGELALSRPAREVLYTTVPRADKYKAKTFIDTFVYRAGDQAGAWCDALLRSLGMATASLALAAVPLSLAWLMVALWLRESCNANGVDVVAATDAGIGRR
jgi:AAA family ATP:ADP antiporter